MFQLLQWRRFAACSRLGITLLSGYGSDVVAIWRRAGHYVDQLLRGAKAADMPVEQRTKFELVLNARTAKTLGLTFPVTLLARADEVID